MSLQPISPCCGHILASKIGTTIVVCENCDVEYQLVKITRKADMRTLSEKNMEEWK